MAVFTQRELDLRAGQLVICKGPAGRYSRGVGKRNSDDQDLVGQLKSIARIPLRVLARLHSAVRNQRIVISLAIQDIPDDTGDADTSQRRPP